MYVNKNQPDPVTNKQTHDDRRRNTTHLEVINILKGNINKIYYKK